MSQEKIKARIRKLLQLADNNPNAAERDSAMRKALVLLARNNLEMADVRENADEVAVERFNTYRGSWSRIVMQAIGHLYFCETYFQKQAPGAPHKQMIVFVGTRANLVVARDIAEWVVNHLHSASEAAWLEAERNAGVEMFSEVYWADLRYGAEEEFKTSFLDAASLTVIQQVKQIKDEIATQQFKAEPDEGDGTPAEPGTALVTVDDYTQAEQRNTAFAQENMKVRNEPVEPPRINDLMAAQMGHNVAMGVNLRNQQLKKDET